MSPATQAWDLLVQATNARDQRITDAIRRVEREHAAHVEMRRAAFMAAIERERMRPAAVPESCAAGLSSPAPCVASDERGHPIASLSRCATRGAGFPSPDGAPPWPDSGGQASGDDDTNIPQNEDGEQCP